MVRLAFRISVALWIAVWATAVPVSAQITTGTLSGSVKDAQGAVVPGATVTLVSAVRGTTTDAQTSTDGDFVFPNVTAGTYLVRVTMDGFKTLERPGVVVSPGDRVLLQTLTIEVGALAETVTVQGETPIMQASSGERSFTVADASRSRTCRSPTAASPASRRSRPASAPAPTRAESAAAAPNNIMMDGISTMDTGNNGILLQMNVESIAEVKVLTSSYQAEYGRSSGLQITAVTKSGTNRFRGSVYGVFRDSDWNSNSRTNVLNGDPKTVLERKGSRLFDRRPGRQAGRQQQAVLLLQPRVRAAHRRQQRRALPHADGPRTGRRFLADLRQQRRAVPVTSRTRCCRGTCSATSQAGCFNDGGVLGRIPGNRLYQTGINLLNLYPLPNINGAGLAYNYELTRPDREGARAAARDSHRLPAVPEAARDGRSTRASASATRCSTARCPASTTRSSRTRSSARWR